MEREDSKKRWESSFARQHGFTVSDELLAAIGATVICQSDIEDRVSNCIGMLCRIRNYKITSALTANMSFKMQCAALSALARQVFDSTDRRYSRILELIGALQHFEEFRNQIAHSMWAGGWNNPAHRGIRSKITARQGKGVVHHREEVDTAQISEEIKRAKHAMLE